MRLFRLRRENGAHRKEGSSFYRLGIQTILFWDKGARFGNSVQHTEVSIDSYRKAFQESGCVNAREVRQDSLNVLDLN